ncbi:MAG TPA: ParB N-terminal domain-containing protein [Spirochaetota bacterium]|nr:ParB N-terminal domain-containing protein [Spirochaetota bacterium]HOM38860.1 ParB N-terminal domain-containing protein [Spirochaetota bacterium]HPQ49155.1 ParB N-terminal domain-containing protein [Spirochaetota bacterium]
MQVQEIVVEKIKVSSHKRIRKNLGDIESLKDSIRKYGLFHPIVVNQDYELLAGARRLEAVKQLGWNTVPAIILDVNSKKDKFEIEVEENMLRKEFTVEEIQEMIKRKRKIIRGNIFVRFIRFLKRIIEWLKNLFS